MARQERSGILDPASAFVLRFKQVPHLPGRSHGQAKEEAFGRRYRRQKQLAERQPDKQVGRQAGGGALQGLSGTYRRAQFVSPEIGAHVIGARVPGKNHAQQKKYPQRPIDAAPQPYQIGQGLGDVIPAGETKYHPVGDGRIGRKLRQAQRPGQHEVARQEA